jgi:hypothetical protein
MSPSTGLRGVVEGGEEDEAKVWRDSIAGDLLSGFFSF